MRKEARITAICNQKGGVGKTVTAVNLGIGLAREGKRVLLVDVDAQGSLTASLGYKRPDQMEDTLAVILEDAAARVRVELLYGVFEEYDLIARALAGRPEILVLDNADSALDYQTAARLWAALRRDFPRTTLVIISERVASVRDADCILVLEHGRILASGRHQDLLVSAPRYRKMAELQMGGEAV